MVLFAYSRATKDDAISSRKAYTLVRLLLGFTNLDIAMGELFPHLFPPIIKTETPDTRGGREGKGLLRLLNGLNANCGC